jgi:adenylate cyclase
MAIEIERKFLVDVSKLPELPKPYFLKQGYLASKPTVRIRTVLAPDGSQQCILTIKGPGLIARTELEYPIPLEDAPVLFGLCKRSLEKRRYKIGRWELDHFTGLKRGELWMAEIELSSIEESFERPAWIGEEVTGDPSYSNNKLADS